MLKFDYITKTNHKSIPVKALNMKHRGLCFENNMEPKTNIF